jgi:glycosyltransferase involved in cell wall biosynthesis
VLVLPSLLDGFGMVVSEALAHGLPVITTRNTGAADLIEPGINGWVIDAGNVEALAERLEHCIARPAELEAMREAAELSAARRPWSVYRSEIVDAVCASLPR